MRLGRWQIKRGERANQEYWDNPGRGFIISYRLDDGENPRLIASYPVAKKYYWVLYPWILCKSIKAVREHRDAFTLNPERNPE